MLDILEELQPAENIEGQPQQCIKSNVVSQSQIEGCFCSDSYLTLPGRFLEKQK